MQDVDHIIVIIALLTFSSNFSNSSSGIYISVMHNMDF
ncbi:hypothetical protein T4D_6759 [Trichinella pseudospiralis]|uniref:Uncharacterized protein n=1 Tax=Trichinella pseudospiralis TaxID=6337 RepID=A0A0V1C5V9_TRIPS|nr:hypothetical protein T4D_6759 [Trichinella pseudospiralis]